MPSNKLGPNVVIFTKDPCLLILIGNKTTQRESRTVDSREVRENRLKLDFDFWLVDNNTGNYYESSCDYKLEIMKSISTLPTLLGVIHLHVILPTGSSGSYFQPGRISYSENRTLPLIIPKVQYKLAKIDVNTSFLQHCNLLDSLSLKSVEKQFPVKKS